MLIILNIFDKSIVFWNIFSGGIYGPARQNQSSVQRTPHYTLAARTRTVFSRGSISKWNRSVPAGDKILAVAQYFNVTTDYLLDDNADISTLAAHHDGEDWTLAELKEIADFKRYVLSKRSKKH